jgi:hypothetical protein
MTAKLGTLIARYRIQFDRSPSTGVITRAQLTIEILAHSVQVIVVCGAQNTTCERGTGISTRINLVATKQLSRKKHHFFATRVGRRTRQQQRKCASAHRTHNANALQSGESGRRLRVLRRQAEPKLPVVIVAPTIHRPVFCTENNISTNSRASDSGSNNGDSPSKAYVKKAPQSTSRM